MRVLLLLCLIAGISAECDFTYDTLKEHYMNFYKHAFEWDMDHFKTEWTKVHDEFVNYKSGFDAACFETDKGKRFAFVLDSFLNKLEYFSHFDLEQKNVYFDPENMKCMKAIKDDIFSCDAAKYDDKYFDFCNDDVDHKFLECVKKWGTEKCEHDHFEKFYELAKDAFKFSKEHHWCQHGHLFYGITAFV